jgi:RNA polymerase sigma-70 factor (ECF subfamily)
MTASDQVQRAQSGDRVAFEALVRAVYDRSYAIADRILRDPAGADDAVQDAIVRCWRDLRALRDPDRFEAWMHRLVVNACRDQIRRQRRRPAIAGPITMDPPASGDAFATVADRDALERGFLALNADQRSALVLTYYAGYSAVEVAAILGVPVGTVYSRLHHGASAMRTAMEGPQQPVTVSESTR